MEYWSVYAHVKDNKVQNIAVYNPHDGYTIANMQAHELYGDDAVAVDVTQWAVAIGDDYRDGTFYHEDGTPAEYIQTADEKANNNAGDITDIELALAETTEDNSAEHDDIQLALAELAEMIAGGQ